MSRNPRRLQTLRHLIDEMCSCGGPDPAYVDAHASWCRAYDLFLSAPAIEAEAQDGRSRPRKRGAE